MQLIEYERHEAEYRLELQRPSRNLDRSAHAFRVVEM